MPSPWVTRALQNDIPAQAYAGRAADERAAQMTRCLICGTAVPADPDGWDVTCDPCIADMGRHTHDEEIASFLGRNERLRYAVDPDDAIPWYANPDGTAW